jgi:membrane-associated phospholipid phosphatase
MSLAAAVSSAPVPRSSGAHGLDKTWFLDVNGFARHTGWLHAAMMDYAVDGGIVLLALLLVVGWWLARRRRDARAMAAALWAAAGAVIALGLAQPVNHAAAEARPWQSLPHALILAGHSTDFSFPSDHAVMAGAVTAGILLYHRRLGIVTAVFALLLCFGRVYIGAHYPQDVAAGLALGVLVVLVGYAIIRIPLAAAVVAASYTPLRLLLTAGPDPLGRPRGTRGAHRGDLASRENRLDGHPPNRVSGNVPD